MARKKKSYPSEVEKRIVELVNNNVSILAMVEILNNDFDFKIGKQTLLNYIKDNGMKREDNRCKKSTKLDVDKLMDMLYERKNHAEIAELLNVNPSTIDKYIKKNNITRESIKKHHYNKILKRSNIDLSNLTEESMVLINEYFSNNSTINYIPNATVYYNGTPIKVDYFFPSVNAAFIGDGTIGWCRKNQSFEEYYIPLQETINNDSKVRNERLHNGRIYHYNDNLKLFGIIPIKDENNNYTLESAANEILQKVFSLELNNTVVYRF